ncbi:hypothetical protein BC828DRAFT_111163 [Blastocladiella britannica]|nr:hypothetical protein BC828DRAFT_111163 [Blastocladiella britannica]
MCNAILSHPKSLLPRFFFLSLFRFFVTLTYKSKENMAFPFAASAPVGLTLAPPRSSPQMGGSRSPTAPGFHSGGPPAESGTSSHSSNGTRRTFTLSSDRSRSPVAAMHYAMVAFDRTVAASTGGMLSKLTGNTAPKRRFAVLTTRGHLRFYKSRDQKEQTGSMLLDAKSFMSQSEGKLQLHLGGLTAGNGDRDQHVWLTFEDVWSLEAWADELKSIISTFRGEAVAARQAFADPSPSELDAAAEAAADEFAASTFAAPVAVASAAEPMHWMMPGSVHERSLESSPLPGLPTPALPALDLGGSPSLMPRTPELTRLDLRMSAGAESSPYRTGRDSGFTSSSVVSPRTPITPMMPSHPEYGYYPGAATAAVAAASPVPAASDAMQARRRASSSASRTGMAPPPPLVAAPQASLPSAPRASAGATQLRPEQSAVLEEFERKLALLKASLPPPVSSLPPPPSGALPPPPPRGAYPAPPGRAQLQQQHGIKLSAAGSRAPERDSALGLE